MSNPVVYLAIDVAKAKLDAFCAGHHFPAIPNTPVGLAKLLKQVRKIFGEANLHVVCEATGGYEGTLVNYAHSGNLPVSVVSPARVRAYAKACNQLAKTDRLDAEIIYRFAQSVNPRTMLKPGEQSVRLQALITFKQQIQEHLTCLSNQIESMVCAKLQRSIKRLISAHEKELKKVDQLMEEILKADENLGSRVERLKAVQGIGKATAIAMVGLMPELGQIGDNQAAALAGLAPFNRDSGSSKGQRSIRGGRKKVRALLYMPTLTAIRINPVLREFYARLRANGKKPMVAITATMRKLVVLFNRLLNNPNFTLAT